MKQRTILIFITIILLVVFAATLPAMAAPKSSGPTISWTNAPRKNVLNLHVGESYTLDLQVKSSTPFDSATAIVNQFYPGRGIFYHGADQVGSGTSATLHLTVTGKEPTNTLPGGYAPASAVVGVRYGGNNTVTKQFDFKVFVTP